MGRKSAWFLILTMIILSAAFVASWAVSSAAPGVSPSCFPTPDEPKPPTSAPKPTKPSNGGGGSGGGGGGGSRFLDCNSSISGFVTDFGGMVPAAGVLVEIGSSGWKSQTPADTNGHFAFNGLCKGTAYVKAVVPAGSLLTNPNAEVELDGKNKTLVDLGYFLPLPQAASFPAAEPISEPALSSSSVPQLVPSQAVPAPTDVPRLVRLPEGVSVSVSAPQRVRKGLAAAVSISVQNGGPDNTGNTIVRMPLASGMALKEADTSRGSLKMQVIPQAVGKTGGFSAPLRTLPSELIVHVGTLAPGDVVLIATKIAFQQDAVSPGTQAEIQARAVSGNSSYWSNVALITVEETGEPLIAVLPTTGENSYMQTFREFLW